MHRDRATTVFTRQRSSPDVLGKSLSRNYGQSEIRPRQHSHSESDKLSASRMTLDLDGTRPTVHMAHPEYIKKIAVTMKQKPNIFYELDQVCF